jgi:Fe-S-cluster containining protein
MLLSTADINCLERKGYSQESFVRFDKDGYALMRNNQGHCVFYSIVARGCLVYSSRPRGCRIYPIIHDEEKGIVFDNICPAQVSISQSEKDRKGKRVLKLLSQIDEEAKNRCEKNSR